MHGVGKMRPIDADKLIRTVRFLTLRDGKEIEIHYVEAERIDSAPTIDAVPVEYIESEKQRLNSVIAVEVKHGDMKEAERLTAIVAVMDAIISNWRYTTGPDWRAERKEE